MPRSSTRFPRTAAAVIMAAVAVAGVLTAPVAATASTSTASTATVECTPLAIIAFRGDGESPAGVDALDDPFQLINDTGDWEGATLHRMLRAYEGFANPLSVDKVPVIAIGDETAPETMVTGYPAKSLWADGAILAPVLLNSAARGVAEASSRMLSMWADADPGCARTEFIVLGYSQGAIAARALAETYSADVVGTFLVADPLQLGDSEGNNGSGSSGTGAVRTGIIPTAQAAADRFYNLPFLKSSLCHEEDPVCSFDLWRLIQASYSEPLAHGNYGESIVESAAKGIELANLVAATLDAPALARDVPPTDILFILNIFSGQANGNYERQQLEQSMDTFREYLELNPNTRVSVKVLGGAGLDATFDVDTIVSFIENIPDSYSQFPVNYPHDWIDWSIDDPAHFRPGADQVVIGVKQFSSNQPNFEQTMHQIITAKANAVRPATVATNGQTLAGITTKIYNAPGASDPDDTWYTAGYSVDSPFEAIYEKVFHKTRAVIGYPSTIVAGQPLILSSEGSVGTDITRLFKIGTAGAASRSAAPAGGSSSNGTLTAPSAGEQTLSLTVTSANGDTSTVDTVVNVLDPADLVIPVSPATGAPASTAAATWEAARAGTLTLDLAAGDSASVTIVKAPTDGSDPFVKSGQVLVGQVDAAASGGTRSGALNVPASVMPGDYLLLVRETSGKMTAIPRTI